MGECEWIYLGGGVWDEVSNNCDDGKVCSPPSGPPRPKLGEMRTTPCG